MAKQVVSFTLDQAVIDEVSALAAEFAVSRSAMLAMLLRVGIDTMASLVAQGKEQEEVQRNG